MRPKTASAAVTALNFCRVRGLNEMPKMIPQSNNNTGNRSRSASRQTPRPAQTGQPNDRTPQSQWQRNYDHYCQFAQSNPGGDAVTREQYWQHAEHFLRLMNGSAT